MHRQQRNFGLRGMATALLTAGLLISSASGWAEEKESWLDEFSLDQIDRWRFQTSILTRHANPRPEHDNSQQLVNFELWFKNRWHVGAAFFDNSYDQNSQYFYVGKSWPLFKSPYFYWRITGGLIHGYKDEYKDKIPLNDLGTAPGIIPAIGVEYKNLILELQTGGISVITITGGFSLR